MHPLLDVQLVVFLLLPFTPPPNARSPRVAATQTLATAATAARHAPLAAQDPPRALRPRYPLGALRVGLVALLLYVLVSLCAVAELELSPCPQPRAASSLGKRAPLASDASSHSSHPSKYFPAPYTPGKASSSSSSPAPAEADDAATGRAKNVKFRSARISAATEDRIRRKRAAVTAAKRSAAAAAAAEPRAAPAPGPGSAHAHARRAVQVQPRAAPVSAQERARRAQVKADSAWVAAHLSRRGLGGGSGGSGGRGGARGSPKVVDERFERKVRGAAGGRARAH